MAADAAEQPHDEYPLLAFDVPTRIKREETRRHVWGDEIAETTMDEIYVSTDTISQVIFSMPPGGRFKDSELNRTVYPTDQIYYVLAGVFALTCPATREVVRAGQGEAIYFGPDTWHHGYNWGAGHASVLEFSAPPARAAVRYAAQQAAPAATADPAGPGRWPVAGARTHESSPGGKLWHLMPKDRLWRITGERRHTVVGVLAATERFTAAELELPPFHETEPRSHEGEESGFVLGGRVDLHVETPAGASWLELGPGDGYYLPAGVRHRYACRGDDTAVVLTQVVPGDPV